ncbi:MAG: phenylalanine--tRNA ligase subunit alpha [Elusimicrobia bacterium]|nr:phenylalanine--tRNA ligase subunit alpha [Elusimicrobiota bacterium]
MAQVTRKSWEAAFAKLEASLKKLSPSKAKDLAALDRLRVALLGRSGTLTELLKSLKDLSIEERRELGPKAQELRAALEAAFDARKTALEAQADDDAAAENALDLTLPPHVPPRGRVHPLTSTLEEMTRILSLMGFSWAEGPLVESDDNNFTKLNIPEHHPARGMFDTFYLKDSPLLMRTHTSPVQIRTMESTRPPLRIISPGRVFRHEAVDATHSAVFHQVEGLYIDKGVSFADLKGTLDVFMQKLFGAKTRTRFRPSYFPFTEPSAEVDVSCLFCESKGCSICKNSGWIELLGAGVVHPNVLSAVGYDPEVWSGFAFGIGVERIAMLRLGVSDIRAFYENDLRFLKQFDENLV